MSTVITEAVRLEVETCFKCGIHFAMPQHFINMRRETKESFWCPNGHSQAYVKSTADQLREEAAKLKRDLEGVARDRDFFKQAEQAAQKSITALRGQVTKAKKRVGNGTCPCCNRHFVALRRHMAAKHPDYKDGLTVA